MAANLHIKPCMIGAFPDLQIWLLTKRRSQSDLRRRLHAMLTTAMSGCVFGHGDTIRTRDDAGYLALQCVDCGHSKRVLEQPAIKGPQFHAAPVKGAPDLTARRVVTRARSFPRSA
jgi:hypothetical protein